MLLVMGPAGAGKSSQSQMIANQLDYVWLSAGKALRESIDDPNVKKDLDKGELVDHETVVSVVKKVLDNADDLSKVVLDGFPRQPEQAEWLLDYCKATNSRIEAVIHINISLDVARERLLKRGRTDDNVFAINERFRIYQEITEPMLLMFKEYGARIIDVNGEQLIEDVHKEIVEKVKDVYES